MVAPDTTRLLITLNPELAKQWHPTKNTLDLATIYASSGRKAWWLCQKCTYEWEARIASRNKGNGCPYCSGKVATATNSLLLNHPEIAAQYSSRNNKPVETLTRISHKKVWWQCDDNPDHEWEAIIMNRVRQGDGCPYCSGRYADNDNNLAVKFPELAAEFNLEKNFPVTPYDLTPMANKKFWWKCVEGHEWFVALNARNRSGKISGCPYCVGVKATYDNNLTVTHPEVAKEFHPTRNSISVAQLRPASHKKVWWQCETGHEWEAVVSSRTRGQKPTGCPECSPTPRTSKIEIAIRNALINEKVLNGVETTTYNAFISIANNRTAAVDVFGYYGNSPVVVEYDSWWWHSGRGAGASYEETEDRDLRKTRDLLDAGYVVVRVREVRSDISLPFLPIQHPSLIQLGWDQKETIPVLVEKISSTLRSLRECATVKTNN